MFVRYFRCLFRSFRCLKPLSFGIADKRVQLKCHSSIKHPHNTIFYPLVHLYLSQCSWDKPKLLNIVPRPYMMIQFSSSSQPHLSTAHGTWGNWSFSYSNAHQSHHYLFAHTVPTFWSTSSLSLYLVSFHVFFKVPNHISPPGRLSNSQGWFRSPPFVLPLVCTFIIRAFITLCCQCLWLAYHLDWTVSSLRAGHTFVIHILICMYISLVLAFRNFIIITSGPSTTLVSQFLAFFSSDLYSTLL